MLEKTVKFEGPYNFDSVLDRLQMDPLNIVDLEKRLVLIPIYVGNTPLVVTVQAIGNIDFPSFLVSCKSHLDVAVEIVSEYLQWNVPLHLIHDHFSKTDLREMFEEFRGTPLILDFGLYTCLIRCLIHQQLNMSFAMTLTKRFAETYGELIDGVLFFPKPEVVAMLEVEDLRAMQFSTRKAEYVIDLSRKIASGELDLEFLRCLEDEEISSCLVKYRGIGHWTVGCFLLFGLGRQNLFPLADIGIQNALKIMYGLDGKPTFTQMEEYSKDWAPYLSYASLYLWRSIEKKAQKNKK
ncbi:MAG: DNA-3-methyladenine glycosylase [Bacillales bacterium]|nr:DNA-3-methyladenine glycosylase [Bacillales bacterium]